MTYPTVTYHSFEFRAETVLGHSTAVFMDGKKLNGVLKAEAIMDGDGFNKVRLTMIAEPVTVDLAEAELEISP